MRNIMIITLALLLTGCAGVRDSLDVAGAGLGATMAAVVSMEPAVVFTGAILGGLLTEQVIPETPNIAQVETPIQSFTFLFSEVLWIGGGLGALCLLLYAFGYWTPNRRQRKLETDTYNHPDFRR